MPVKTTLKKKTVDISAKAEVKDAPVREDAAKSVKSGTLPVKKSCVFCDNKKEPTYTDVVGLRKFMSDRAKIVAKARSGACSKHQRRVALQIKYARHLSLLPFVNRV